MRKQVFTSSLAGGRAGSFPAVVDAGRYVFVSLQTAVDHDGVLHQSAAAAQAMGALENLRLHLQVAGLKLDDVVKLTTYVTDMAAASDVDAVLARAFEKPRPARTMLAVAALPGGAAVGIEAIASRY